MGVLDYLPVGEAERYRLAKMKQLSYKKDREKPLETIPIAQVPVESEGTTAPEKKSTAIKPPTMPQEDYEAALSIFTPERLAELYNGFNPNSTQPFYTQLYNSVKRPPEVPDEKRLQASRSVADLGDALALMVQMIAANQGSFIKERNPAESATARTEANIEKLKQAYRRDRDAYEAGYWGAHMKDLEGARGDFARDRAALLALLARQRDNAQRDKRFQGEMLYKYLKAENDKEAQQERARQVAAGNQIKRDRLAWDKAKYDLPKKDTPKGYLDFYNRETGMTFRVAEKKWKANYTQIFNQIKQDLYQLYPMLKSSERLGTLKPSDKEEYVKQFMYDNPSSLRFLDNIAETKFQDGKPEPKQEVPKLSDEQYSVLEGLVKKNSKDERKALFEIATYLKSQGFSREQVETMIGTIMN